MDAAVECNGVDDCGDNSDEMTCGRCLSDLDLWVGVYLTLTCGWCLFDLDLWLVFI